MFKLSPPPSINSIPSDQQYVTLYSYLYRMAQYLNVAMNSLSNENFSTEIQQQISTSAGSAAKTQITDVETSLKSLILATAETVRTEMNVIEERFSGSVDAVSKDFGRYKELTDAVLEANSTGILQQYTYSQEIQSELGNYKSEIGAYIKTGVVYYDGTTPVYGVAVGGDLTNPRNKSATFTGERLSFWSNGVEVAYVSNSQLYTTDITVNGKITFRNKWQIDTTHGFTIKYIG